MQIFPVIQNLVWCIHSLTDLKTQKGHFEINSPLVDSEQYPESKSML